MLRTSVRSVCHRAWLSALAIAMACVSTPGLEPPTVLNKVVQALQLSSEELNEGHQIEVDAAIVFSDPQQRLLYAQDETGGIFISPAEGGSFPPFAESVQVKGTVKPGSHLPFIDRASIRLRVGAPLPTPLVVQASKLAACLHDSQWIEITARVRAFRRLGDKAELFLAASNSTFRALIKETSLGNLDWTTLTDATIALRGVGAMDAPVGGFQRGMLLVQNASLAALIAPGTSNLFDGPLSRADSMPDTPERRIRVRGALTRQVDEYRLVLKDATGEIAVDSVHPVELRSGDIVEASGFAASRSGGPALETAQVRLLGLPRQNADRPVDLESTDLVPVLT